MTKVAAIIICLAIPVIALFLAHIFTNRIEAGRNYPGS
jgi:hypothetical protein